MNPLILTRSDLRNPYLQNPVDSLVLSMFSISESQQANADIIVYVDDQLGAVRLCKVMKNIGGLL